MTLLLNDTTAEPSVSAVEISFSQCTAPLSWHEVFGNSQPVEIEIGSGKGRFIITSGRTHPTRNFLGIERAGKYFRILKQRVMQAGLTNVKVLRSDAAYFIRKYVPRSSVHAYHIYFPDPWPKKRHHKRRLVTEDFILLLSETLVPGGHIFLATDFQNYFEMMIAHARACPTLQEIMCTTLIPGTIDPEQAPTNYERKYLLEGREIYKATYKKSFAL